MRFAPIVERELKQLARQSALYRIRTLTALCALLIGFGAAFLGVHTGGLAATLGRSLFLSLTALSFFAALLAGPVLTSDCLSEEKRSGTLSLLFLCGMRSWEIVAGKLVALTLPAAQCLLVIFPILGFSFVLGGVTGGEFWRVTLVLLITLLLSLTSGLAVSAVSRQGTRALGASTMILLGLVAGLPFLNHLAPTPGTVWEQLAWLSPFTAWQLAADKLFAVNPAGFWTFCNAGILLSATSIGLACACLPFSWREKSPSRLLRILRLQPPATATRSPRTRARRRWLLDADPLVWLATRKQASTMAVWLVVGGAMLVVLFGFLPQTGSLKVSTLVGIFFLIHGLLKILVAWDASRRFADERESGALELLLCSPVEERGLWRAWFASLKRTYLLPFLALGILEFYVLAGGMRESSGWWNGDAMLGVAFAAGLVLFVADTYAVCWLGVWQGIAARNSTRACLNTMLVVLFAPTAATLAVLGLAAMLGTTMSLPFGILVTVWFVTGCAADMAACGWAMLKLNEEFRAAVAHATGAGEKRSSWRVARKSLWRVWQS